MKQNITIKHLLLSAVAAAGLATSAFAGGDEPNTPKTSEPVAVSTPVTATSGLLGEKYASLSYRYVDFDGSAGHADDYRFGFNEPLKSGLDGLFDIGWTDAGAATRELSLSAGLRAYRAAYTWGTPYVEAAVGYTWEKIAGVKDDSFLWQAGIGVEFAVAPAVTVTPYVKYDHAPGLARDGRWDFGVKANYWVNQQWAVTVGIDRDDDQNTGFMVGTNFRY